MLQRRGHVAEAWRKVALISMCGMACAHLRLGRLKHAKHEIFNVGMNWFSNNPLEV